MKNNFIKNIFVFIFSMFAVLIYFKILTYYIKVDILAKYFEIKALGMILYYLFSIRYSELSYLIKSQNEYTLYKMNKIYSLYLLLVILFSFFIIICSQIMGTSLKLFIYSYIIFLLNDLIDSYVAINRLYHKYLIIISYKALLIFKPLLFYIYFIYYDVNITITILFEFELLFHFIFALLIIFTIYIRFGLLNIFLYKRIYLNNMIKIKNTWLGSISKIPYEALPTYLLSYFVSNQIFVEYNIARKVYAMVNFANQPFIQVLNTYSISFKKKFKKYLVLYFSVLFVLNLMIGIFIFNYGELAIEFLSHERYITKHTLTLIYIMFSIYMIYNIVYPIRQYIILNNLIKQNNIALLLSIILMLIITILFIPYYGTYAVSVIQPFGMILPILITLIIINKIKKEKL